MNDSTRAPLLSLLDALIGLTAESDLPGLFRQILFSAVGLLDADEGELRVPSQPALHLQSKPGFTPSSTAIAQANMQQSAILWNQGDTNTLDISHSVIAQQLTSILVAPFGSDGYLYLQRRGREQPFQQGDREVFSRLVALCARLVAFLRKIEDLRSENTSLRAVQDREGLVYACAAMEKLVQLALKVSPAPIPVVLHGETGTGKEVLARFIHRHSPRAAQPFVAINCGAIPAPLIESILFGHRKGAFTGASESRKGVFEDADGGTLFLDEVAELPLDLQVKLLRVLQEKCVTRIGDSKEIPVDIRLLSASHQDLATRVSQGHFREDLFFRLNVMQLELPPLRDRGQDILVLGRRFLERYTREFGLGNISFSHAAENAMLRHNWPGNVRELENRIQKGLVQCDGAWVEADDLGLGQPDCVPAETTRTLAFAREVADRNCIDLALRSTGGNLTMAGQILGIDRKVLREHLERLGIDKESYRQGAGKD